MAGEKPPLLFPLAEVLERLEGESVEARTVELACGGGVQLEGGKCPWLNKGLGNGV